MKISQKIIDNFDNLISKGKSLIENKTTIQKEIPPIAVPGKSRFYSTEVIDVVSANKWGISCLNYLERIVDKESIYYQKFFGYFSQFENNGDYRNFIFALSVLETVRDDFSNGLIINLQTLVEAEVFDDFLEQAEHLFKKGYYQPAAVIAGCVLEDGLRKLCNRNSITLPAKATIEPMNVELAKAGIYNKLIQKKITAHRARLCFSNLLKRNSTKKMLKI